MTETTTNIRPGRIDAISGLHGLLITYHAMGWGFVNSEGIAIVQRDDAPIPARPYSVHHVAFIDGEGSYATNGEYDLTLAGAYAEFQRRTGIDLDPKD